MDLYHVSSDVGMLDLKDKLRNIHMSKGESIIAYLSKFI